jgi:hypothetical protein
MNRTSVFVLRFISLNLKIILYIMKSFTKLAALLLAIVAVLHLLRVVFSIEMTIDNIGIPMWISIVGFIIPAILSIGLLKESKR